MKHIHRAISEKTETRGWAHCVTPHECAANPSRQAAHGNVVYIDTCSCGAVRQTESNTGRRNYGGWMEPEMAPAAPKRIFPDSRIDLYGPWVGDKVRMNQAYLDTLQRVDRKAASDNVYTVAAVLVDPRGTVLVDLVDSEGNHNGSEGRWVESIQS